MARVGRAIDTGKILRLKQQIEDPTYVESAVDRLAGRITERLLGLDGEQPSVLRQRSASSSRRDIASLLDDEE